MLKSIANFILYLQVEHHIGSISAKMRLQPKEAGAYIAKHAKWLKINLNGVDKIVDEVRLDFFLVLSHRT